MHDVPGNNEYFCRFVVFDVFGQNRCSLNFQIWISKKVNFECQHLQSSSVHETGLILERVKAVLDGFREVFGVCTFCMFLCLFFVFWITVLNVFLNVF